MSEQLRIILIIIVSVSIFGLIVFVIVKNYIKSKIQYYLEEKNKKSKEDLLFLNIHLYLVPLLFWKLQNQIQILLIYQYLFYKIKVYYLLVLEGPILFFLQTFIAEKKS